MVFIPPQRDSERDPDDESHGLDEAKKRLDGMMERPCDIDKTIADLRARKDRERERDREITRKLEATRLKARQMRTDRADALRCQEQIEKKFLHTAGSGSKKTRFDYFREKKQTLGEK